jgi:hypothetical protein
MRLTNVSFGEDEMPQEATFVLSVDEAALIYAIIGYVSPKAVEDASGDARWSDTTYKVADCLGNFFDRFWENGHCDVAPRLKVKFDA